MLGPPNTIQSFSWIMLGPRNIAAHVARVQPKGGPVWKAAGRSNRMKEERRAGLTGRVGVNWKAGKGCYDETL